MWSTEGVIPRFYDEREGREPLKVCAIEVITLSGNFHPNKKDKVATTGESVTLRLRGHGPGGQDSGSEVVYGPECYTLR